MRGGFGDRGGRGFGDRGGRGGGRGFGDRGGRGGGRGFGDRGGRGGGRGFGGRGGARGGRGAGAGKVTIEPHMRHPGVFVARGKTDTICTLNMVPGVSVYGEKRVEAGSAGGSGGDAAEKKEYRLWNPYRSKLASAVYNGVESTHMAPGSKVLYLGGASGTTVSHVSDLVGPTGMVYAVEFSHRSGRDLVEMAKRRPNIVPIIEDARHPVKYRALVPMVDCIFMDVAQPDQARILALNAQYFLKNLGHYVISIKANCIDSTMDAAVVFASEVDKMRKDRLKPLEQVTLEPFERDHAVVVGVYRSVKAAKAPAS